MQQTETYKLNLIEKTDTFSPDALNQNAQKVDSVLARLDAAAADLDQRLEIVEVHRIAIGTYTPAYDLVVEVGFRPKAVVFHALADSTSGGVFIDTDIADQKPLGLILDNGFQIVNVSHMHAVNNIYNVYAFVALA